MATGRVILLYITSAFCVYTSVQCQKMRQWKDTGIDDVEFTDYLNFDRSVRSLLECGQQCSQSLSCLSFTFTKLNVTSGRCRGHFTTMTSHNAGTASSGTRLYHRVASPWLNQICSGDDECPDVPDSECFEGKCLCTPGYYYSVSTRLCVRDCAWSDLQTTFVEYPRHYIASNNVNHSHDYVAPNCRDWCASTATCRTCELRGDLDSRCNLQNLTPLDVPSDWKDAQNDIVTFWQKMCE